VAPSSDPAGVVKFGEFQADFCARELRHQGTRLRLPDQSFQVLAMLLKDAPGIVTREEIRKSLWPDQTFVDFDHGLNNAVNRLRDALGDSASSPSYIETLPRRGYRFIAPVTRPVGAIAPPEASSAGEPEHPVSRAVVPVAGTGFRRLLAVSAVAFTCLLAAFILSTGMKPKRSIVRSLAVLPFENLSGDPAQDYFAAGVTDAVITELARIESLRIVSRTSVLHYQGTRQALPDIARELQADAVVEGSVVRSGNRVRITAQLVEASSDRHLWAKAYDLDVREILSVQRDVAKNIVTEVQAKLSPPEEAHLSLAYEPVDPEAYSSFLEGRYYLNRRSLDGYNRALTRFQRTIALSPEYAPAYAGLADCYNLLGLGMGSISAMEAADKAREAAEKALQLDPDLAEAHAALAFTLNRYDWNWTESEKEYRRALEIEPGNQIFRVWFSQLLGAQRRSRKAEMHAVHTPYLDPSSVQGVRSVAAAYVAAKQFDRANAYYDKAIASQADSFRLRMDLATGYSSSGEYEQAVKELKTVIALYGPNAFPEAELGYAYARLGERTAAEQIVAHLQKIGKPGYSSYSIARIYVALGSNELALSWLDRACRERAAQMSSLNDDAAFATLHPDSRFQDILRRIGLPLG